MKKNILVTGANGYIGSHITSELIKKDSFNVIATDFNNNNIDKKAAFINKNKFILVININITRLL